MLAKAARLAAGRLALVGRAGSPRGPTPTPSSRAGALGGAVLQRHGLGGGPGLVVRIKRELAAALRAGGLGSVSARPWARTSRNRSSGGSGPPP